jgi:acetyl esterase/lipase
MPSLALRFAKLFLKHYIVPTLLNKPLSVAQRRAWFQRNFGQAPAAPNATIHAQRLDQLPIEVIRTPQSEAARAVMFLHGGAYVLNGLDSCRALGTHLAAACAARVITVDYRLAPEHPFPAAVEDAATAYRWLLQTTPVTQIAFIGDSAGGGLAVATMLALRNEGLPLPAAAVLFSPWVDLELTGESHTFAAQRDYALTAPFLREMAAHYAGHNSLRTPLISPIYADLRGLPPLLIQVGRDEILLSDSRTLATHAREAGVSVTLDEWPDVYHVWQYGVGFMPEAQRAVAQAGKFVKQHV